MASVTGISGALESAGPAVQVTLAIVEQYGISTMRGRPEPPHATARPTGALTGH